MARNISKKLLIYYFILHVSIERSIQCEGLYLSCIYTSHIYTSYYLCCELKV
jgi:hypothetical protein